MLTNNTKRAILNLQVKDNTSGGTKMTLEEIFRLAHLQQTNNWNKEMEELTKDTTSELNRIRERNAWDKLKEIENLAKELGIKY